MRILTIRHKGLERLIEDDDTSGLPAQHVGKIRKVLAFLQDMESEGELRSLPSWRPHMLVGSRKSMWSLSVTRNWRITFRIDHDEGCLFDLNYEDYH